MAAQPVSWRSLIYTARAPIGVLLFAAIGLLLPPQTDDMLAALAVGTVHGVSAGFMFQLSLALVAVSCWYWSRAALSARFGASNNRAARNSLATTGLGPGPIVNKTAIDYLPRLLFLLAVLLGCALLWRSFSFLHLLWVAAWAIPGYALIHFRLWLTTPANRPITPADHAALQSKRGFVDWWRRATVRFRVLLRFAPFGPVVAGILLLIGILVFVFGAVESLIVELPGLSLAALAAGWFPGPSAVLLGLALMIGPLSAITFIIDGLRLPTITIGGRPLGFRRPPIFTAMVIWVLVWPWILPLHIIRTAAPDDSATRVEDRKPLHDVFEAWVKACGAPGSSTVFPVIVAISGGASRAAVWAASVLQTIDALPQAQGIGVFAVSSVSGGSLGAAAYMAALAAAPDGCRSRAGENPDRLKRLNEIGLGKDALGPLLAGALLDDVPRAIFSPVEWVVHLGREQPHGGDRAEALERAFEAIWADGLRRTGIPAVEFSKPYLSLFYVGKEIRPGMPIWIANGTDKATGQRLLTVPFASKGDDDAWPFHAAGDLLGLLGADVPISTAINNTARFPYLEPAGELSLSKAVRDDCDKHPRCGTPELLDGGYFDNEGLLTALDLARWLSAEGAKLAPRRDVRPIIVQVTADADPGIDFNRIERCLRVPVENPVRPSEGGRSLQLLSPIMGLYNVRGGHAAVLLREARDAYCQVPDHEDGKTRQAFFHFYLPDRPGRSIPLNWMLSDETADFIWQAIPHSDSDRSPHDIAHNKEERDTLKAALGAQ